MTETVLRVTDLRTQFVRRNGAPVRAVEGVSISVAAGQTVGIVGESGCGKTTLGLSILRLVPEPGRIVSGSIELNGRDLLGLNDGDMRRVRGDELAMSFQDPTAAFNPLTRVGAQIREAMTAQGRCSSETASTRTLELLRAVSIPDAETRARDYPHEFSGGMRQRAMVAMGIANHPSILVADEPTTGIDVTVQAQVVELLRQLNHDLGMAILLITHDMGLVASLCDRVVVMYAGRVVEEGDTDRIFHDPQHPYTWSLLRSVPRLGIDRRERLMDIPGLPPDLAQVSPGCTFRDRCQFRLPKCEEEPPLASLGSTAHRARCWVLMGSLSEADVQPTLSGATRADPVEELGGQDGRPVGADTPLLCVDNVVKHYSRGSGPMVRAVDGVSLVIGRGETLALIGESGCGKTTLARVITQLLPATSGRVVLAGRELAGLDDRRERHVRREIQMVFQNPASSLDPRMSIARSVAEPLLNYRVAKGKDLRDQVTDLLELVGLTPDIAQRHPHEISGGQRQRVGIARALALRPSLIVCDEPVSSLDVSVQAQIINLLQDLQSQLGLAYLFITHDLSVVRHLADRVAVMYLGKIVESATSADLFGSPQHPYTQVLLDAVSPPDPRLARTRAPLLAMGDLPSPTAPPTGCHFHTRCPIARAPGVCRDEQPALGPHGEVGQQAACHFAGQLLAEKH